MLKKLKIIAASLLVLFFLSAPFTTIAAQKNSDNGTPLAACNSPSDNSSKCKNAIQQTCASRQAEWQTVNKKSYVVCASEFGSGSSECKNPIWNDLKDIINALSAGVAVVVTIVIIIGGIQYTAAGDQTGQVEAAKKRIANALFALVAFFLTWAFLQWIIPTGVFHPC